VFNHEGPTRNARKNAVLAGYLALVAGFVNSGGYVLIGSFTSHVTGSVGRLAHDLAVHDLEAGLTNAFSHTARAYAAALAIEGGLLATFIFAAGLSRLTHPRALDAEAAVLCLAMGMQNSLVTRLSGAVVRTTHLTGVVTDLGIEAARWYRWHRARMESVPLLIAGRNPPQRPPLMRSVLLLTIVGAFAVGAVSGAVLTLQWSRWAMVFPAVAVLLASAFAFSPLGRADH
jgi:uncharacterized membrane protein YoaK (UPF0700 family)